MHAIHFPQGTLSFFSSEGSDWGMELYGRYISVLQHSSERVGPISLIYSKSNSPAGASCQSHWHHLRVTSKQWVGKKRDSCLQKQAPCFVLCCGWELKVNWSCCCDIKYEEERTCWRDLTGRRKTSRTAMASINDGGLFLLFDGHLWDSLMQLLLRFTDFYTCCHCNRTLAVISGLGLYKDVTEKYSHHKVRTQKQDIQFIAGVTVSSWIMLLACLSHHFSATMQRTGHHTY